MKSPEETELPQTQLDFTDEQLTDGLLIEKKEFNFSIHFSYLDSDYNAQVHKTATVVPEYRVTMVNPAVDHLPEPFVVAVHFSKEKFDFPVNETYYPLAFGLALIEAIKKACGARSIPLFE